MEKKQAEAPDLHTKTPTRRRRKKVDFEKLRQDAGGQLQLRLEKGELSTADLLKVMAFNPPDIQEVQKNGQDWVLVLQGEK